MKRGFLDNGVREALGRILRDAPAAGDGKLLLEALESLREMVPQRLIDACALQAEYGRRKLAHDLIEIGREEFERVTAETSLPSSGKRSEFSGGSSSLAERGPARLGTLAGIASRRRGPAATWKPPE